MTRKSMFTFRIGVSQMLVAVSSIGLILTTTTITHAAKTFTVNSTSDHSDSKPGDGICKASNGKCTLRAAIQESNALSGRDVIKLPAGTYKLTNSAGNLVITDSLALDGVTASQAIIDGSSSLQFQTGLIIGGDNVSPIVNISGTTIRNFKGGGGIYVYQKAYLSLNRSTITGNNWFTGGGIYNDGSVDIIDSIISNNGRDGETARGGGIASSTAGTLKLVNSTVSGNAATGGAGINSSGKLEITNSTISGNKAGRGGGGIQNTGTASISYSTITENVANSRRDLSNTDAFGGGIKNAGGTVDLGNSILARNSDNRDLRSDNSASPDCWGNITSFRGNLVGINKNCTIMDSTWGDTRFDQVGTVNSPIDPRLAGLASNGGRTQTHALLSGSPAIDKGDGITSATFFDCPKTDQRGTSRPLDGKGSGKPICDVGAYEFKR
jgi:CSLREA domain-containing protein